MTEFAVPVRIYYEDTDASGVVYHANYLRYFERARTEWVRARGLSHERLRLERGLAFTVADMQIAFVKPARMDDALEATVRVAECRRASLVFEQELRAQERPQDVRARARVRVACVDLGGFKPCALPAELQA
ncbi:MAG: tol-pal system-associated acyl-CoA thioesterase [Gammaproteobacteria bacterium]|nr:tol-pal system-associated acyl-CoA thioesterase [Gammaproteobacteria bacterium]